MNYELIPERTINSLKRYVFFGVPTGGFLQACLENNLVEAFSRADEENTIALKQIVSYIYNELPYGCWGSEQRVRTWLDKDWSEKRKEYHELKTM